jgi:hypothetical protein
MDLIFRRAAEQEILGTRRQQGLEDILLKSSQQERVGNLLKSLSPGKTNVSLFPRSRLAVCGIDGSFVF